MTKKSSTRRRTCDNVASVQVKPIVLWGSTGQARVLAEFLPALGFRVVALFDNDPAATSAIPGVPLHHGQAGFETWNAQRPAEPHWGIAAIGGKRGADRVSIHELFRAAGLTVPTLVHPQAWIATNASVGEGSQILARTAVAAFVSIGPACLVNTSASVDHDCVLEEGVHVGPGAVLAGEIVVGARAFLGTGAVVLPRVRIGADAVVGAGAVVHRDVPPGATVAGVPARVLRRRA